MTYTIIGYDPDSAEMGAAVQSHYFAVGGSVLWARPGIGVVATQSVVNPLYGSVGVQMLSAGVRPDAVVRALTAQDSDSHLRQVAVMDASGDRATHTGTGCIRHAGTSHSNNAVAVANLVAGPGVWHAMTDAFESTDGSLAHRLLTALRAGQAEGGDLRGMQAAAITVVGTAPPPRAAPVPVLDIRVDDAPDPLTELGRLLDVSQALSGLVDLIASPGLLFGEFSAMPHTVADALEQLEAARIILGPNNCEPAVWAGMILARAGRTEEARDRLRTALDANSSVPELVRHMAASGMWTGDEADLDRLLPTSRPDRTEAAPESCTSRKAG